MTRSPQVCRPHLLWAQSAFCFVQSLNDNLMTRWGGRGPFNRELLNKAFWFFFSYCDKTAGKYVSPTRRHVLLKLITFLGNDSCLSSTSFGFPSDTIKHHFLTRGRVISRTWALTWAIDAQCQRNWPCVPAVTNVEKAARFASCGVVRR